MKTKIIIMKEKFKKFDKPSFILKKSLFLKKLTKKILNYFFII